MAESEQSFEQLLAEAVEADLMADAYPGPDTARAADDAYHVLTHYPGLPIHVIDVRWQLAVEASRAARQAEASDGK